MIVVVRGDNAEGSRIPSKIDDCTMKRIESRFLIQNDSLGLQMRVESLWKRLQLSDEEVQSTILRERMDSQLCQFSCQAVKEREIGWHVY